MQKDELQEWIQQWSIDQWMYLNQRTHKNWTLLGDKNTKYFQSVATINRQHNMWKITDEFGKGLEDPIIVFRLSLLNFSKVSRRRLEQQFTKQFHY